MERVGIRELRNNVAAVVRRASRGERVVVTVDGVPAAQLGPLEATAGVTLDDLVAAGSFSRAREAAQVRMEGRDYVVREGDVLQIRFNV